MKYDKQSVVEDTSTVQKNRSFLKYRAQALPEYALCLALVTFFCIAAVSQMGGSISGALFQFGTFMQQAASNAVANGGNPAP
jgi:Flp pilus assembly pilin Flp